MNSVYGEKTFLGFTLFNFYILRIDFQCMTSKGLLPLPEDA